MEICMNILTRVVVLPSRREAEASVQHLAKAARSATSMLVLGILGCGCRSWTRLPHRP